MSQLTLYNRPGRSYGPTDGQHREGTPIQQKVTKVTKVGAGRRAARERRARRSGLTRKLRCLRLLL